MAYGKVDQQFYTRPEVKKLSPFAKLLLVYYLTNHHRNFIGVYYIPKVYVVSDLGITNEVYDSALEELKRSGLIFYDDDMETIFVAINLEHNPITSDKQVKGAIALIKNIRSVKILREFLKHNPVDTLSIPIRYHIDTLCIPYGVGIDTLFENSGYPMNTLSIEETVTVKEEVKVNEKTTPPQPQEDNKKENITYCKTKGLLEIARTTYRKEQSQKRLQRGMSELELQIENDKIKYEAECLFALEVA